MNTSLSPYRTLKKITIASGMKGVDDAVTNETFFFARSLGLGLECGTGSGGVCLGN